MERKTRKRKIMDEKLRLDDGCRERQMTEKERLLSFAYAQDRLRYDTRHEPYGTWLAMTTSNTNDLITDDSMT